MGQCDNCMKSGVKTRRLELGGGSGMSLCDNCLRKEIKWRREKNKHLIKIHGGRKKAGKTLFRTKYKF